MKKQNPQDYLQFLGSNPKNGYGNYRICISKKNIEKLKKFLSEDLNPPVEIPNEDIWVETIYKEKIDNQTNLVVTYIHMIIVHSNYGKDLAHLMKFLSKNQ